MCYVNQRELKRYRKQLRRQETAPLTANRAGRRLDRRDQREAPGAATRRQK